MRHAWKRLLNLGTLAQRPRPEIAKTPAATVHRENKWQLLRYHARSEGPAFATPVLLVPSLINRHYVLDLTPGKSFVEWLVARGHDVYVIDWGTPGPEDRYLTFDTIADRYLGRALRHVSRASSRGAAHVLGYCMGGTLAAVHLAAHESAHAASFCALATPVRFADDPSLIGAWSRAESFDAGALVAALGNVPWQLLQSAFHLLRPTLPIAKATHVLDRAWNDEFLDGFLALETWGNDNVSFPGACFQTYVEALYREDALAQGTFRLSGRPAPLSAITCPTLTVTFAHDNIVPEASAAPLHDLIGAVDKHRLHLPGGHVGAVVSRKAAKGLWPTIARWWEARDRDPNAAPTPTP